MHQTAGHGYASQCIGRHYLTDCDMNAFHRGSLLVHLLCPSHPNLRAPPGPISHVLTCDSVGFGFISIRLERDGAISQATVTKLNQCENSAQAKLLQLSNLLMFPGAADPSISGPTYIDPEKGLKTRQVPRTIIVLQGGAAGSKSIRLSEHV